MICEGARCDEITVKQDSASKTEEPAPGACLPIGVTASGEVVFPLLCKDFLDRTKGVTGQPTAEQGPSPDKPASRDSNSDVESKVVQKPLAEKALEEGQAESNAADTVASIQAPLHASSKPRTDAKPYLSRLRHVGGSRGCAQYRTFDPDSATYRDYSGHRRACR
jgi:hypothetical protein